MLQPPPWIDVNRAAEQFDLPAATAELSHQKHIFHQPSLGKSADGIEWKVQPFEKEETPRWLAFDGNKFIAGSYKTGWESADGIAWKKGGITTGAGIAWTDGTRYIATGWPGNWLWPAVICAGSGLKIICPGPPP